jgi:predicted nucleic acid-binding protein
VPDLHVVDSSVALKWVSAEPDRDAALRLFDRYVAGEVMLIAPDLLLIELASVISKRSRRKEIEPQHARHAFEALGQGAPQLYETRPLLLDALALSIRHESSLWDCVYLTLALAHNCPFLTADRRLFRHDVARHAAIQLLH